MNTIRWIVTTDENAEWLHKTRSPNGYECQSADEGICNLYHFKRINGKMWAVKIDGKIKLSLFWAGYS